MTWVAVGWQYSPTNSAKSCIGTFDIGKPQSVAHCGYVISQCLSLAVFECEARPEAALGVAKINLVNKALQSEGETCRLVRLGFSFVLFPFFALMKGLEIPGKLMLMGLGNKSCGKVLKRKGRLLGAAMKGKIPV